MVNCLSWPRSFVEIVAQTDSLDRALSRTHANLTTANVALGTFAGNVAASFARMAVGAAGGLFEGTVRSASHLTESVNKVNVLFGDSAKLITGHAQEMADAWSEPKQAVIDMTNNFALMGREIGYSQKEAAEFGVKVSKMALDARSLGDAETAARKIEAALAGQARPLRSLGIFINANTVKEEAARMGMQPGASGQLSEGQKIKARMSLIENSEFMKKAAGDLGRTFQETEGQTRAFWGALSNLGTSIGEELNPAWNKLLQSFNSGLGDLKGYFEANKGMIRGWADSVVEGFETAKVVWRNLPDVMNIALLGVDVHMQEAKSKTEIWATEMAVAIEKAFLGATQTANNSLEDVAAKVRGASLTASSYGSVALQKGAEVGGAGAEFVSQTWDAAVEAMARKADVVFRPIRDASNAMERGAGLGNYKQMSVEEDISRAKGALSGLPKFFGGLGDFFAIHADTAAEMAKQKKPYDEFASPLQEKADKHLAEVRAQQAKRAEESQKGIAALQEKISREEAARLDAATKKAAEDRKKQKHEAFLQEFGAEPTGLITSLMRNSVQENLKKMGVAIPDIMQRPGKGKGEEEDEAAAVLDGMTKHQKGLEDTASFHASLMAEGLGGDVQQKQLTELQMIREIDQKNADMMEKMYTRSARAVYA